MLWETRITNAVNNKMKENNGIYIPPRFQKNVIPMFHLDNIDWLEDTPDGKKTSKLLQSSAFQPKRCQNLLPIVMDLNVTDKLTLVSNNFYELLDRSKPQNLILGIYLMRLNSDHILLNR